MSQPSVQYLNTISYNQHKIHKCLDVHKSLIFCKKQIIIKSDNLNDLLLYQTQIELVKDYLQRKNGSNSHLSSQQNICIINKELKQTNQICLQISQPYWEYPTLKEMFRKMAGSRSNKFSQTSFLMFIEELFQLMLKGGGIDNFFYTSTNIFVNCSTQTATNSYMQLIVNPFSMNGLKLLFKNSKTISRQAFQQIYPCLPVNFFQTSSSLKQKQVVIKKKCLAYLILCYIIGGEPIILDVNKSIRSVHEDQIKKHLNQLPKIYKYLLQVYSKSIQQAQQNFKINFKFLLQTILLRDAENYSWNSIYIELFQTNIINIYHKSNQKRQTHINKTTQTNQSQLRTMHMKIWEQETKKQFYIDRNIQTILNNQEVQVSMTYLMVKCNVDFRRLLRHLDLNYFLNKEMFSPEGHQIMNLLMKLYKQNVDSSESSEKIVPPQKQIKSREEKFNIQSSINIFNEMKEDGSVDNKVKLSSIAKIGSQNTFMVLQSKMRSINSFHFNMW